MIFQWMSITAIKNSEHILFDLEWITEGLYLYLSIFFFMKIFQVLRMLKVEKNLRLRKDLLCSLFDRTNFKNNCGIFNWRGFLRKLNDISPKTFLSIFFEPRLQQKLYTRYWKMARLIIINFLPKIANI